MAEIRLSDRFEAACRSHGPRTAFYEASGAPISFDNVFFTVLSFAEQLQDRGVAPGDLVSVGVDDALAGTALRLALIRLGAVAMPEAALGRPGLGIDWHLRGPNVGSAGNAGEITVDAGWIRSPRRVVPVAGGGRLVSASSGTTGLPKLRVHDEAGLLARIERGRDRRGATAGPAYIGYGPGSSPGLNGILRTLLTGQPQVHAETTPEASLATIDRVGVTTAYLPPYAYGRLVEAGQATGIRPRALTRILVGGGALSAERAAAGEALFACEVFNSYGSGETGSIAHCRPAAAGQPPGAVGAIYADMAVRIVAESGRDSGPDEEGELWLRPPAASVPRAFPSGAPLGDAEGWIATGDIGRLAPGGIFVLTGRRSEFLNVGGNKRAPSLFEDLARRFPGIADIAAFRAPAPSGSDEVGLAVVPRDGFDRAAFEAFLARELGRLYPTHVVLCDGLPYNAAGKVDRRRLTDEFLAVRAPAGDHVLP